MDTSIAQFLKDNGAFYTNSHLVLTSGMHATEYLDVRAVSHIPEFMIEMGERLASMVRWTNAEIIIGPNRLGKMLVAYAAPFLPNIIAAISCEMRGEGADAEAFFDPKLDYGRLLKGRRVVILDDLLNRGGSIEKVRDLILAHGGIIVGAFTILRRDQTVEEIEGIPMLESIEDVVVAPGISPEECAATGPCSRRVPMRAYPGHGKDWFDKHPRYPVVLDSLR